MAWMIPAAIFGGALLGGSASRSAASTQADAASRASDAQLQAFREQAALQEPFRQGGLTAQQQIMQLLGIGGDETAAGFLREQLCP